MNNVVIFDLDNCLSNDGWRIPLIDHFEDDNWTRYLKYHQAAKDDQPANLDKLEPNTRRAIFTARPAFFYNQTIVWLQRHGIEHHWLLMRNNDDLRSCVDVKRTQLGWFTGGEYDGVVMSDIIRAYDDRPDVIRMYRRNGIDAHVLSAHSIDARAA